MEYVTLNNGVQMPKLGYGVYQTPLEETARCVLEAMEIGYRSIDTAQAYGNEAGVGRALEESGLHREELFLTTKIWISNAGYEKAKASIAASLEKLRTNYIDLLLIHQPFGDYYGSYRAMEEAWRAGTVRAIGVSNFYRPLSGSDPFCRDPAGGQSGGDACVPAAENRADLSGTAQHADHVLGSLCRREKRLFS